MGIYHFQVAHYFCLYNFSLWKRISYYFVCCHILACQNFETNFFFFYFDYYFRPHKQLQILLSSGYSISYQKIFLQIVKFFCCNHISIAGKNSSCKNTSLIVYMVVVKSWSCMLLTIAFGDAYFFCPPLELVEEHYCCNIGSLLLLTLWDYYI